MVNVSAYCMHGNQPHMQQIKVEPRMAIYFNWIGLKRADLITSIYTMSPCVLDESTINGNSGQNNLCPTI